MHFIVKLLHILVGETDPNRAQIHPLNNILNSLVNFAFQLCVIYI